MNAKSQLRSIAGLKVFATAGIFVWHCGFFKSPDLGARCVEIFLVVSGFLTAYNHHGTYEGTLGECVAIVRKKLRAIYPVYLAGFLLAAAYMVVARNAQGLTRFGLAATALVDLTLMQAWIPSIAFKYDGAAWFLSAALVCYAASPFISRLVECAQERLGDANLGALAVGAGSFAVLLFLEVSQKKLPSLFNYSVHICPPLCLLRFLMGYAAACLSLGLRGSLGEKRFAASVAEVAYLVFAGIAVVVFNDVLPRSVFTLVFTFAVLLLSFGLGLVSRLLGATPLLRLGRFELDFYVFHQPCIWLAGCLIGGRGRLALLGLALTVGFVALWRALKIAYGRRSAATR